MIRLFLATACALFLASCAPDNSHDQASNWPEPTPALWEVYGPDGETGWLFGTIHALPEGVSWRTSAMSDALAQSDLLVVEISNLDDASKSAAQFAQISTQTGLPSLSLRVSEADRPVILSALDRAGLKEADLTPYKTWSASLILANVLRRYDAALGVDRALLKAATRVHGLESFAKQYQIFNNLSVDDQAQLLVAIAAEASAGLHDAQISAWLRGDISALEQQANAGLLANPALREQLQIARNRSWVRDIDSLIRSHERPFVAVGAAHMIGPQGLPALLSERGYTIRRIQ